MLKIKLTQDKRTLTMQVLEQCDKATRKLTNKHNMDVGWETVTGWKATNGLQLISVNNPAISYVYPDEVLFRGDNKSLDDAEVSTSFGTDTEAEAMKHSIIAAVKEFNDTFFPIRKFEVGDKVTSPDGRTYKIGSFSEGGYILTNTAAARLDYSIAYVESHFTKVVDAKTKTFKPGDRVFTPAVGFVTLDRLGGGVTDGEYGYEDDGRKWPSDRYPTIKTLEEASLLGHKPPKRKVKKIIELFIHVDKDGTESSVFFEEAPARAMLPTGYTVVKLSGEVEVEVD